MNESYAEAGVKRKKALSAYMIQIGAVLGILAVFFIGSAIIGSIATFIASVLIVLCFFFFPRLNSVEYEYIYCDGQIDFDRITGNSKRKTQLRVDFEKVEIMAPVNSHSLDSYNRNNNIKVRDFSSLLADRKVYALIYRGEGAVTKILFEPSEKMIDCIKHKTPRKISEV